MLIPSGYYRVNYDTATWENIREALKANNTEIHPLNRVQIVDDTLNLARGELLDYNLALSIVQYLEDETNYLPWYAALNNFIYVQRRFTTSQLDVFKVIRMREMKIRRLTLNSNSRRDTLSVWLTTYTTFSDSTADQPIQGWTFTTELTS